LPSLDTPKVAANRAAPSGALETVRIPILSVMDTDFALGAWTISKLISAAL